jgi:hypothetical protein
MTSTKSHAQRGAGQAQADQDQQPHPEPEAAPAGPYAQVGTESYPQTFHRPQVKVTSPDGEVIETITTCPHEPDGKNKWGHKDEKAAMACARKIAAQRGLRTA